MKSITALLFALMMTLMVASAGFAHETGDMDKGDNQPSYKAVPKAMHEKVFPKGHPATERWSNHCYYVVAEDLYFCADDVW